MANDVKNTSSKVYRLLSDRCSLRVESAAQNVVFVNPETHGGFRCLEVDVGFINYKFLSCLSEGVESPGYAVCGSLVRGG